MTSLTEQHRSIIADTLTEWVALEVRKRVSSALVGRLDKTADPADVVAIERQIAVQLITGLRSSPLETDTEGKFNALPLYRSVLSLLGEQSTVDGSMFSNGEIVIATGMREETKPGPGGTLQPAYLIVIPEEDAD